MKFFRQNIFFITLFLILEFCGSTEKKEKSAPVIEKKETEKDKFFLLKPVDNEAFRIYSSSDEYSLKQTGFSDFIIMATETSGKNPLEEEIKAYDMVDIFTEAVYKVELFKESGLISKIRPIRPAHISEINKMIADDISRFKFKFKNENITEPLSFKIRYGIQLQKKKTKDEIRKILKENVHE